MDAQGEYSPPRDGFRTPLPSSPDSVTTPSPPPAPKRNRHRGSTTPSPIKDRRQAKLVDDILHWLEESCERYLEECRRWESSDEALEAQRIRKLRVLMSLR